MSLKAIAAMTGFATAFLLSGCSEKPADKAARVEKEDNEARIMLAAKDRIERVQGRFTWEVNKRSCVLTDKTDGTKYDLSSDGTVTTSGGPAEFLKHGSVSRAKNRCYVTDFVESVRCEGIKANESSLPSCKPAEL